jgi:uncharacterized protein
MFGVKRLMAFFIALVLLVPVALATDFPTLAGDPVVDQARILSPAEEQRLSAKLRSIEKESGHQVAVATITSLEDLEIEDYGLMLGRRWGIGRKNVDDGVMILVAPNDRKMRLEVGVGLEQVITNAVAQEIVDNAMKPRFKTGDFAQGIAGAIDAIGKRFSAGQDADATDSQPVTEPRFGSSQVLTAYQTKDSGLRLGNVVVLVFVLGGGLVLIVLGGLAGSGQQRGGVVNWNSNSASVYMDSSPRIFRSSAPAHFSDSGSSSPSSSDGDGGRFRGGGASGSW